MTPGFSAITNSKFYHPAFNSAIFDGPIRIYFVQFHESYALKIYFMLQDHFKEALNHYKDIAKKSEKTLLIMIYPTEDSFQKAFEGKSVAPSNFAMAREERECVFGLLAPVIEDNVGQLMDELSGIFKRWDAESLAEVIRSAPLRIGLAPEIL
ncbi:MAG: hypothetical protein RJB66_1212 [Pseudomonadota bacterium]|jgi:hypothetical protein